VTSTDATTGLIGLIVVLARQNDTMAEIPKTAPVHATATATPTRSPNGTSTGTINKDASHMRKPTCSATSGGGTFSSSEPIATNVRHSLLLDGECLQQALHTERDLQ
jgi:hypothetical protein